MKRTAVRVHDHRSAEELQADSLRRLARNCEPPPPGERAEDELTGDGALDTVHQVLQDFTAPATEAFPIKDIHVRKFRGRVVIAVKFARDIQINGKVGNEVVLRTSAARAETLRLHLTRALDKRA